MAGPREWVSKWVRLLDNCDVMKVVAKGLKLKTHPAGSGNHTMYLYLMT